MECPKCHDRMEYIKGDYGDAWNCPYCKTIISVLDCGLPVVKSHSSAFDNEEEKDGTLIIHDPCGQRIENCACDDAEVKWNPEEKTDEDQI